jgi:hypothetical protein
MEHTPIFVPGLVILLAACLLTAGCSVPGSGDDQTSQTATATITGPLLTEGDIVQNPSSTAGTAWLVIGYDAASDSYDRALIYPNSDGSWGHRLDTRTEKAGRAVMEKVYTEIVANRLPSSVPVVTPTIVTPAETTRSVVTTTVTATPGPQKPVITRIIPETGFAGTNVTLTDLAGENFVTGANVSLSRSGSSTIKATGVRVVTPKSITCTLAIPADAVAGAWDVTVRNPDGQSATYTNIFTVRRDTSVVTTTGASSAGSVPITGIDPPFAVGAGDNSYVITGSKFQNGASVILRRADKADINAREVIVNSETEILCFFTIPTGSMGTWDILITNPDQSYGRKFDGFEIRG